MTRMQHTPTARRLALTAAASLLLLAAAMAPAQAQSLPSLPIDADAALGTPLGSVDARTDGSSAQACADLYADADSAVPTAEGLAGSLLPVPLPEAPIGLPQTPKAGIGTCVEADLESYQVSAETCTDAHGLNGTKDSLLENVPALPVELPQAPVDVDGASTCIDAAFDDGEADAGIDADAGPVQQGFRKSIDALKGAWGFVRGLF